MIKETNIKFLKIRNVKSPSRAYKTDAGIDFYVPEFTDLFIEDFYQKNDKIKRAYIDKSNYDIVILPNGSANIPSGIKVKMDENLVPNIALIAFNKSGIATKKQLTVGACVVDHSYQGEIHINVINTTNLNVRIHQGDKLIQLLEIPVYTSNISVYSKTDDNSYDNDETNELKSEEGFFKVKTERGDKGFGSTN